MAAYRNRYGLERDIPEAVKREVRQHCGFGCVVCGAAICEYEHFNPPFMEARAHLKEGIALLCGGCHGKVTRKLWSKEKIAMAWGNPCTFKQGCSKDALDVGAEFSLVLGSCTYRRFRNIIATASGQSWFSIDPPEAVGAPCQVSVEFRDEVGACVLKIEHNELVIPNRNWDVEFDGPKLTIRTGLGQLALVMRADPGVLTISRLSVIAHGVRIEVLDGMVTMERNGAVNQIVQMKGVEFVGNRTILAVD
jgi:hypothetical protein